MTKKRAIQKEISFLKKYDQTSAEYK